jgi:hypothetical protein
VSRALPPPQRRSLIELEEEKRLSFGDRAIAPTRVGNMVNALSAYTRARYNFNIALLWPRLQNGLPAGTYGSLQDAKAERDSLIALLWIGMATTAAWSLTCIVLGAPRPFVAVAAGGPLAAQQRPRNGGRGCVGDSRPRPTRSR